jgi:16S rRNA pseudouridine516 synthase
MQTKSYRIDRFISKQLGINRGDIRLMLAQGRVVINAEVIRDIKTIVNEFDRVALDGKLLQDKQAIYIMLHKPIGVVSATKDDIHPTVMGLLPEQWQGINLHLVGRLDLNTSGLLLLTNDGRWSKRLMSPQEKVSKVYQVGLENPLNEEYISAFAAGMYFPFEDITTQPACLTITADKQAEVVLQEGKYHQIKRMFGRFRNPVVSLHRSQVGQLKLDETLAPGQSRLLTAEEVVKILEIAP